MIPSFLFSLLLNRFVIGGLAIALLVGGAYFKGYSAASALCHEAQLREELAAVKRDMLAWKLAGDIEKSLQAEVEAQRNELQQKVRDYEDELAKRPDGRCSLTADDVRRLHGIGGK